MSTHAALLREAAKRIDDAQSYASPGSWYSIGAQVSGGPYEVVSERNPGEDAETVATLPSTIWAIGDAFWMETVSPQVAAPLVAWLRAAADACDSYPNIDGPGGRMMRAPDMGPAYRHTAAFIDGALVLARSILGIPAVTP